jgi:2,3-bisphosphoglycerate-independent phosphoglycerate mutase
VPVLLSGPTIRVDAQHRFNEIECAEGGLGIFPAKELLPTAFAHAGRLTKYGA